MSPLRFRLYDKAHYEMLYHEDIERSDKEGLIMWGEIFSGKEPHTVLMQSTGLHDKNGKEIFEGDVLQAHVQSEWDSEVSRKELAVVNYEGGGFVARSTATADVHGLGDYEWSIVGNAYEHPELLPSA